MPEMKFYVNDEIYGLFLQKSTPEKQKTRVKMRLFFTELLERDNKKSEEFTQEKNNCRENGGI